MDARAAGISLLLLTSCGEPPVESRAPDAVQTSSASPRVTSAPTAFEPPAPKARVPRTDLQSIGDTTCSSDADCAMTTKAECCDCCPSRPMATSAAWLGWRDGKQCAQTRCEPCGKVACVDAETLDLAPMCDRGKCVLSSAL